MIYHSTNIFVGPLVLLIWIIDIYVVLASARLILGRLPSTRDSRFCRSLQLFTDPVAEAVDRYLTALRCMPIPSWQPWAIVIVAGIIIRHLLAWIVVAFL